MKNEQVKKKKKRIRLQYIPPSITYSPFFFFFFFLAWQDFRFFIFEYLTIIYILQIETNLFFYFSYENI